MWCRSLLTERRKQPVSKIWLGYRRSSGTELFNRDTRFNFPFHLTEALLNAFLLMTCNSYICLSFRRYFYILLGAGEGDDLFLLVKAVYVFSPPRLKKTPSTCYDPYPNPRLVVIGSERCVMRLCAPARSRQSLHATRGLQSGRQSCNSNF